MSSEVTWIRDDAALAHLAAEIGAGPLALDTESDSLHHYPEKVCLVQLSFAGRDVLVDPLAGVDPRALGAPLGDPALRTILHGADYDVRVLRRDFGLAVRGLYDTMIAARLAGEPAWGLGALLERHLGVRLDKRFQRADWSLRPLPPEMERYAVLDTRHLAELAARLDERLASLGREAWAREEFERVEEARIAEQPDPEPFRRVRGAAALDRRRLALLRAVVAWREAQARRRDRPPFRVFRDEVAEALVRAHPATREELRAVAGVVTARLRPEEEGDLLRAMAEASALPLDACPRPAEPRRPERPEPRVEAEARRLGAVRDRIARELALEASLLAPRAVVERAAARLLAGEDPLDLPEVRRWQRALLLPAFSAGDPGSRLSGGPDVP